MVTRKCFIEFVQVLQLVNCNKFCRLFEIFLNVYNWLIAYFHLYAYNIYYSFYYEVFYL